jgi:hypothetical protein
MDQYMASVGFSPAFAWQPTEYMGRSNGFPIGLDEVGCAALGHPMASVSWVAGQIKDWTGRLTLFSSLAERFAATWIAADAYFPRLSTRTH